jgi:folylpolyglutamate synthase/dihydropteroate synthase
MLTQNKRSQPVHSGTQQRNYQEIIEFLDSRWATQARTEKNLIAFKKLDKALGEPSSAFQKIVIGGTNGKTLTAHFTAKLLEQEGLTVGAFASPHILTYNERFSLNNEAIANKLFTEIANEVINAAVAEELSVDSLDLLTAMASVYFKQSKVDVALLEQIEACPFHPFTAYNAQIVAITRLTDDMHPEDTTYPSASITALLAGATKNTYVLSADQSKAHLQLMLEGAQERGASWAMPIRKLAALSYPFEQLHGRCAALAERISQLYIQHYAPKNKINPDTSLLAQEKGQRGRPTIEAKRQSELNPRRTVEQFWKETVASVPARFNLLDKEKPSILLDNASNIDALKNLFLGIRLLHYQRPFKGLTFIFGCNANTMFTEEFLRLLRYFTKKNSAHVIFYPISNNVAGLNEQTWDVEKVTNDVKNLKIKAKCCASFDEAFENAKHSVDERNGLIVITGSQSVIVDYWHHKGIKKL